MNLKYAQMLAASDHFAELMSAFLQWLLCAAKIIAAKSVNPEQLI
jgi:hypothetical protein